MTPDEDPLTLAYEHALSDCHDNIDAPEFDYVWMRNAILYAFNPGDDDIAEPAILEGAIRRARDFIAAQPCTCSGDDQWDACRRCDALGRFRDEPVSR